MNQPQHHILNLRITYPRSNHLQKAPSMTTWDLKGGIQRQAITPHNFKKLYCPLWDPLPPPSSDPELIHSWTACLNNRAWSLHKALKGMVRLHCGQTWHHTTVLQFWMENENYPFIICQCCWSTIVQRVRILEACFSNILWFRIIGRWGRTLDTDATASCSQTLTLQSCGRLRKLSP